MSLLWHLIWCGGVDAQTGCKKAHGNVLWCSFLQAIVLGSDRTCRLVPILQAFWAGHDKLGRPCLILAGKNHWPKESVTELDVRLSVYMLEKSFRKRCGGFLLSLWRRGRLLMTRHSIPPRMPAGVYNFITVFDLRGMTRKNQDLSMLKALARTLQANYPEFVSPRVHLFCENLFCRCASPLFALSRGGGMVFCYIVVHLRCHRLDGKHIPSSLELPGTFE